MLYAVQFKSLLTSWTITIISCSRELCSANPPKSPSEEPRSDSSKSHSLCVPKRRFKVGRVIAPSKVDFLDGVWVGVVGELACNGCADTGPSTVDSRRCDPALLLRNPDFPDGEGEEDVEDTIDSGAEPFPFALTKRVGKGLTGMMALLLTLLLMLWSSSQGFAAAISPFVCGCRTS